MCVHTNTCIYMGICKVKNKRLSPPTIMQPPSARNGSLKLSQRRPVNPVRFRPHIRSPHMFTTRKRRRKKESKIKRPSSISSDSKSVSFLMIRSPSLFPKDNREIIARCGIVSASRSSSTGDPLVVSCVCFLSFFLSLRNIANKLLMIRRKREKGKRVSSFGKYLHPLRFPP